jgi:predicted PP-loop superfamily ATPase
MTTRAERLNQLKTAVDEWADREEKRLEDEVEFLQSMIDGHTASGSLSTGVTSQTSALIADEINEFLK